MNTFKWKTPFAESIFRLKYAQDPDDSWPILARRLVDDVCGTRGGTEHPLMSKEDRDQLEQYIIRMQFIPGGRYLYYAGRPLHFYNNCFCLKAEEDTREEWGSILKRASDCLMSGGGIGIDYSVLRPSGRQLSRTGGISSGPIPLMHSVNEVGRNVMQGGSRRSAIFATLNWQHEDIVDFMRAKDWSQVIRDLKAEDFNFPAPLDMTNISISWDTKFADLATPPELWYKSVERMCKTGEPGHCYNFYENENDTLRNA
jgi:ribonucleoside-diphosphate reductase alpha chain